MSGNRVFDPESAIDRASDITYDDAWPKGYMHASFKVKRSDIFADWVIRESYGVIIWSDADIVWQGRIEAMPKTIQVADEFITVNCAGWYALLEERDLRKRWIDIKAISYLRWPDGLETSVDQTSWVTNNRDKIIQVFAGTGDVTRQRTNVYRELYELPAGSVRRISFDYIIRSGEYFWLVVKNKDNPAAFFMYHDGTPLLEVEWYTISGPVVQTGAVAIDFQLGNTGAFELEWYIDNTDLYDQNDYGHVSNLRVESNYEAGHRTATPTYTQGQLVEDVILLVNQKGAQLSTDFSQLGDPGRILDPFVVEEPTYAGPVIEKIASYGDTLLRTWGLCVWDQTDTSDGKPRVVFEARDVSDYEYVIELSATEMASLNYEKISDNLFNSVTVQYIDERDATRYRTSADNAALKDQASIDAEYQRDFYLKIGEGDATTADFVGKRYIEYHKDRETRGTFSQKRFVTTKAGGKVPYNQVRSGQRFKLLNTGEILFIRSTNKNAENKTVQISPDLPVDNIQMLFAQRLPRPKPAAVRSRGDK